MVEATERSMPAVATTNVCPTARTTRIALACRMASMLPVVRNVESSAPKTRTRTSRAAGAASSGHGAAGSRWPALVVVVLGGGLGGVIVAVMETFSFAVSGTARPLLRQAVEGVVEGRERGRELGDRLVGDVLRDERGRCLDGGGQLLAVHGGLAGLDAHGAEGVRVLRDGCRQPASLDCLECVLVAVDGDDGDLAGLLGVGDRTGDAQPHVVVRGEEALEVRVGAHDVGCGGQGLLPVPVRGDGLHDGD